MISREERSTGEKQRLEMKRFVGIRAPKQDSRTRPENMQLKFCTKLMRTLFAIHLLLSLQSSEAQIHRRQASECRPFLVNAQINLNLIANRSST